MERRLPGPELIAQVARHFTATMTAANLAGAIIVSLYLTLILPVRGAIPYDQVLLRNGPPGLAFLACASLLVPRWGRAITRRRLGWMLEERPPTAAEQRATLRNPLAQLKLIAGAWALAALTFGLINLTFSAAVGGDVALGIATGGVVTCAICYLAGLRALRPITARALEHGVPLRAVAPGITARTLLSGGLTAGVALLVLADLGGGMLSGQAPLDRRTAVSVIALSVLGLLAGGIATAFAAKSIAEPIQAVRRALAEIEEGRTDVAVAVDDAGEIGLLQAGFNRMAAGLRERELLRDLFGRHVGREVAQRALQAGVELGGELRPAGILFVDVIGSTAMAIREPPEVVVARLNAFFALVLECVSAHGGWVNKFEGDAALCLFGVPEPLDDPAGAALAAGRELCTRLDRESPLPAAVGVSAGEVVAGNIGAAERLEYTAIGDPVNEAARLCEAAKQHTPRLLASGRAVARAGSAEAARWQGGEAVTLRGRSELTLLCAPVPVPVPAGG